jgi:hypothetical protein
MDAARRRVACIVRADVTVVAGGACIGVVATRTRVAEVGRAGVVVVAVTGDGIAGAVGARVANRAGIAVITRNCVVDVCAPRRGVATVSRADVLVIARLSNSPSVISREDQRSSPIAM